MSKEESFPFCLFFFSDYITNRLWFLILYVGMYTGENNIIHFVNCAVGAVQFIVFAIIIISIAGVKYKKSVPET